MVAEACACLDGKKAKRGRRTRGKKQLNGKLQRTSRLAATQRGGCGRLGTHNTRHRVVGSQTARKGLVALLMQMATNPDASGLVAGRMPKRGCWTQTRSATGAHLLKGRFAGGAGRLIAEVADCRE